MYRLSGRSWICIEKEKHGVFARVSHFQSHGPGSLFGFLAVTTLRREEKGWEELVV